MEVASDSDSSVELVTSRNLDSNEAQVSEDSSSSSGSRESTPDAPILLSIESPKLSALITALNATSTLNSVFSNFGKDITAEIDYDPEWFRRMTSSSDRAESTEEEWQRSVRIELQILNAFLDSRFQRMSSSTGNLESLFRMKMSRAEESKLEVGTIFKILVSITEISDCIMQYAKVESEEVPVLPIPVEVDDYAGSLQGALDRVFWPYVMGKSDVPTADISQIPVLTDLCDVLLIQSQQMDIELDEEIWPERYTEEYQSMVLAKWNAKKEQNDRILKLNELLQDLASQDGKSIPRALEITIQSLESAGANSAAGEIKEKLSELEIEISEAQRELENLRDSQEVTSVDDKEIVPIDTSKMTPYELKAILWTEVSDDEPMIITRNVKSPAEWLYSHGCETYVLDWSDVVRFASKTDNYLAVYEKKKELPTHGISPSVQKFVQREAEQQSLPHSTEHIEFGDDTQDSDSTSTENKETDNISYNESEHSTQAR